MGRVILFVSFFLSSHVYATKTIPAFGAGASSAGEYADATEIRGTSNRLREREAAAARLETFRAWALGSLSTQADWVHFHSTLESSARDAEPRKDWARELSRLPIARQNVVLNRFFDKILVLSQRRPEAPFAEIVREASHWFLNDLLPAGAMNSCEGEVESPASSEDFAQD